jgi:hypothetical protein
VRLRFTRDDEVINPWSVQVTSQPAVQWDTEVSEDGHFLNLRPHGGFLASGEFYEIHVVAGSFRPEGSAFWDTLSTVRGALTGENTFAWDMSLETRTSYAGPSEAEERLAEGRTLHYSITSPRFLQADGKPSALTASLGAPHYTVTLFRAGGEQGHVAALVLPGDLALSGAFVMEGQLQGEDFFVASNAMGGLSNLRLSGRLAPDHTLTEASFSAEGEVAGAEGVMESMAQATDVTAQLVGCVDDVSAQVSGHLFWGNYTVEVNVPHGRGHHYSAALFEEGHFVTSAFSDRPEGIQMRLRLHGSLGEHSRLFVFRDGYLARIFWGENMQAGMPFECAFPH